MPRSLVEVAVAVPVEGTFTYRVPQALRAEIEAGHRVLVPFGRRKVTGYVLQADASAPAGQELRDLIECLDPEPILTPRILELARWAARYYQHPLGEVIRTALPPGINVHSERRVALTEAGRAAVEAQQTPAEERDALMALAARPDATARVGGRRGAFDGRLAERLLARGWVRRVVGMRGARVRTQMTTHLRAVVDDADAALASLERAPAQKALLEWLLARGRVPLEELRAAFPRAAQTVRKLEERGLVERDTETASRTPSEVGFPVADGPPPEPTGDQAGALKVLEAALGSGFAPHLLQGVTGSGKTEVYMRLIEAARRRGDGALVLVPEISLTPQLVGRFRMRFGDEVAVLHSGLSDGERHDEWWRIRRGQARVAVGVRSAVFAPVERLGVIVVDEEHDASFKQEEGLRYHARDLALVRGRSEGAVVVLGSATPSLETVHNARAGRYQLLALPHRIHRRPLPDIEVIDLRRTPVSSSDVDPEIGASSWMLTDPLMDALGEVVRSSRQAILFLNRRGFTPSLLCQDCGAVHRCPNCEVSLTLHRRPKRLLCHYCAYETPPPPECESCGGALRSVGVGTQSIEDELGARLPGVRVSRLDRDTTSRRGQMSAMLADFALGRADVLIGTQMVAKGHDFPGVTLVGVVLADHGLLFPDVRAAERTYQLLSQVAGRAGRGEDPGRVIIQSWRPDHSAVALAATGCFEDFAAAELETRRQHRWPPFCRLLMVRVEGNSEPRVARAARRLAAAAERAATENPAADLEVLGPAPAPLARLRGKSRWQVLIKAPGPGAIEWVGGYLRQLDRGAGVQVAFDVDPVSML